MMTAKYCLRGEGCELTIVEETTHARGHVIIYSLRGAGLSEQVWMDNRTPAQVAEMLLAPLGLVADFVTSRLAPDVCGEVDRGVDRMEGSHGAL